MVTRIERDVAETCRFVYEVNGKYSHSRGSTRLVGSHPFMKFSSHSLFITTPP
jgi:hypothetical protein